jgi:pimeloyl-ACP methyl ester carboxylesterase
MTTTVPVTTRTVTVTTGRTGPVEIRLSERGEGRPILLLHGGAGPLSVGGYADELAAAGPARVITPTHPGFDGTGRPDALTTITQVGQLYAALLAELDLDGVTVVGNSIGGWIAAELALTGSSRLAGLVIVDAVGIEVPGHPVVDFFSLTFPQIAQLSYHDPERFRIDPAALPPAAQAAMAANRATLAVYAGQSSMADPGLRARLGGVTLPTLVIWGDADGIADPDYGRAYADAIPGARFELLPETGHMPQVESPDQLTGLLRDFAAGDR